MNTASIVSTRSLGARIFLFAGVVALSGASCESCTGGTRGGGGGGNSSGGGWLVGQSGLMLNVTAETPPSVLGYKLDLKDTLRAIGCRGDSEAWVVGDGGVVLATSDGGDTWRPVASGVRSTLRAVSLAAEGHVFVAGDDGVLRVSRNGLDWDQVPAPPVAWTSIAARKTDGRVALLTTANGQLFRYDSAGQTLTQVGAVPTGALHSVVLTRDGGTAVAVGEAGTLLVSTDGGTTWRFRSSGTEHTLRDVWLIRGGEGVMAVGDAGTVIEASLQTDAPPVVRTLASGRTLRALHLEATGHGTIVGDQGTALVTHDFGQTFTPVPTNETRDILAVDALELGAHL